MQSLSQSTRRSKAKRTWRDVARDLLAREPRLASATVRGWLAEVEGASAISLLDGVVLRAIARACGVAEW